MKRYLLFCGDHYYPAGGFYDLLGSYDTEAEALSHVPSGEDCWAHVIDRDTMQCVFYCGRGFGASGDPTKPYSGE